ncbi:MAG: UDP-2,4-diacetamido-2,4,6-trideoxy-beta-L-altropyranose hydrolase [Elusimicrobiota bacterium]
MKAAILTEGGLNIGYGHITRCMGLYQALKEARIDATFYLNGKGIQPETLKGVKYRFLNWLESGNLSPILKNSAMCVIDSYLAGINVYKRVFNDVKACVFIDDNMRLDYPGGIVSNGTVLSEQFPYKRNKLARYLLGSRYAPMRKPFWGTPAKIIKERINDVLITFGGTDPLGMTASVLEYFALKYPLIRKHVVTGASLDKIQRKRILALSDSRTSLYSGLDANGMKNLMLRCDIAVSAAGQTTYELARAGVPSVIFAVAGNQIKNSRNWQKTGFALLGSGADNATVSKALERSVKIIADRKPRAKMSGRGRKAVDGQGARRIVSELLKAHKWNCNE